MQYTKRSVQVKYIEKKLHILKTAEFWNLPNNVKSWYLLFSLYIIENHVGNTKHSHINVMLLKCRIDISFAVRYIVEMPTSVTHLNARPTGDQHVAGSIPAWSATFFRGVGHETCSTVILVLSLSGREVVSFWRKNVHNTR